MHEPLHQGPEHAVRGKPPWMYKHRQCAGLGGPQRRLGYSLLQPVRTDGGSGLHIVQLSLQLLASRLAGQKLVLQITAALLHALQLAFQRLALPLRGA